MLFCNNTFSINCENLFRSNMMIPCYFQQRKQIYHDQVWLWFKKYFRRSNEIKDWRTNTSSIYKNTHVIKRIRSHTKIAPTRWWMSSILEVYMKQETIKFKFVTLRIHRRNTVEKAMSSFNDQFIASLASIIPHMPMHLWCCLLL